jgi:predicted phage-related endonuclease
MSIKELEAKAQTLKELQRMQEELEAEITATQDEIKEVMTQQGADTITAGAFKITWKPVTSSRLDAAALKKELPELAARFTKETTARRFIVA